MYRYRYFDYTLVTDLLFPELEVSIESSAAIHLTERPCQGDADLDGVASDTNELRHVWQESGMFCRVAGGQDQYQLVFPEMLTVSHRDVDAHLTYSRDHQIADATLRHLLIDQALPRFLSHWGDLILHASAVSLGEMAIAFAGASGLGKSTLAGAFQQRGWEILSDDCIKVCLTADEPALVYGGYASLRLYDDSARSLLPNADLEQTMADDSDKYRISPGAASELTSSPLELTPKPLTFNASPNKKNLSMIVILSEPVAGQSEPVLEPVSGAASLFALLSETFSLDPTLKSGALARVEMLAALLEQSPRVFSLAYPRDYACLPKVIELIRDAASQWKSPAIPVASQPSLNQ